MTALPTRRRARFPLRGVAVAVVVAACLLPLVWMVSLSLRPAGQPLPARLELLPPAPTLANYPAIFGLLPLARYAANSVFVATVATAVSLLTASLAACAMAQLGRKWRDRLVGLLLAVMLVPVMALWLPRFLVFKWLGVLDTPWALVMPALFGSSPLYVLILYWACRRIPADVYAAARLDGCSALRLWWSVALPIIRPTLAAVAVLAFVYHWSSFTEPLLYLSSADRYTLPVGLRALQQFHPSRWPLLMAGATVVTLPVLLIFVIAQRAFVRDRRDAGPDAG